MTRFTLVLIVVAMGCAPASSVPPAVPPSEPSSLKAPSTSPPSKPTRFDFKGDTPGVMTVADFARKYGPPVKNDARPGLLPAEAEYVLTPEQKLTVANQPVLSAHYTFFEDRLRSIFLEVDDGEQLFEALTTKYGPPDEVGENGKHAHWRSEMSTMLVGRRGGYVIFRDNELERRVQSLKEEGDRQRKEAGANDL